MRLLRVSLALSSLGLLMSTLSGCMTAAHAVFQNIHEANATPESMGVSTATFRDLNCSTLGNLVETYTKEQHSPQNEVMTSKYYGWQIDAINQVRAEKACSGDAAAQAAAPKVQLYGFCYHSPLGNSGDPDDYDTYITPNFLYRIDGNADSTQLGAEFSAYLRSTMGMSNVNALCVREDSLAKLEAWRDKVSAESDNLVGNDDIAVAWQPTEQAAPAQVAAAPMAAVPPVASSVAPVSVAPAAAPAPVAAVAVRGWLGAYLTQATPLLARELGLADTQGALLMGVAKNSAADRAGLRSLDVIQAMDDQLIVNHEQLVQLLASKQAGASVAFKVWRGRQQQRHDIVLSATATPSKIEAGPGYCYAYLPAIGSDQIGWVSSPFPVPDATASALQVRGKTVGQQFRSFLLGLGMANQVGSREGYGICNAGLGNVEQLRNATLSLADHPTIKASRVEIVNLVWAP